MYALKEPCGRISLTFRSITAARVEGRRNLTEEGFILILEESLIPRGSKSLKDYAEAKRWAGTLADGPQDYERLVQIAAEYVGV